MEKNIENQCCFALKKNGIRVMKSQKSDDMEQQLFYQLL